MLQRIIRIDEEKCNGCGACVTACAEGAIGMVDGKARLVREDYCDGLGNCLPACPADAIRFEHVDRGLSPQWPIQIKLVPVNAPFFNDAALLVSADCCAYAYPHFHAEFTPNKTVLIGCPKLDNTDYAKILGEIIAQNNIASVTVVRMEVPCCAGITNAVVTALKTAAKPLPLKTFILTVDGEIK
ncbi:MAG: 4Fe-4S binding protein [Spirochaetaceae bacterium]|jgi:ferredoxin|nr:4Fe-4S binding protein [Spirochaetaceae bacterium]